MKFIDLFCGIGGFRVAFENQGAECVFSSDIDKFACETYKLNFGEYPLSDITKLESSSIPDFNILCAGFPCQPFSIAGKRRGFQDSRGTLFYDIERILRDKKPDSFILENVKGLINHDKGKTLNVILNTLAKNINGKKNINSYKNCLGYNVFYKVLNSLNYGLPQNRERVYIVGFKNSKIKFDFPTSSNIKININEIIQDNVTNHHISEIAKFNILNNLFIHKKYNEIKDKKLLIAYEIRKSKCSFRFDGLSPTLTAKMGTGGNNVPVFVNNFRKFTVNECLAIQGFPRSFIIDENKSQSYKQIGNSVSVPVVSLIAKNIISSLNTLF